MRKILSTILAVAILCTALPFWANAIETDSKEDTLITRACEVFPEYADKIRYQETHAAVSTRSSASPTLVHNETRAISDTEGMSYSEYDNGMILLSSYEGTVSLTTNENSNTTSGRYYDIDIVAQVAGINGSFTLSNVKFMIATGETDRLISAGTPSKEDRCTGYTQTALVYNESGSSKAKIAYKLTFRYRDVAEDFYTTNLTFYVGGDTYWATHINPDI